METSFISKTSQSVGHCHRRSSLYLGTFSVANAGNILINSLFSGYLNHREFLKVIPLHLRIRINIELKFGLITGLIPLSLSYIRNFLKTSIFLFINLLDFCGTGFVFLQLSKVKECIRYLCLLFHRLYFLQSRFLLIGTINGSIPLISCRGFHFHNIENIFRRDTRVISLGSKSNLSITIGNSVVFRNTQKFLFSRSWQHGAIFFLKNTKLCAG